MFLKKFVYTYRNYVAFIIQNIIPIIFLSLTIVVNRAEGLFVTLPPLLISLASYPSATTVLQVASNVTTDTLEYKIAEEYKKQVESMGSNYKVEMIGNKDFSKYILDLGKTDQLYINGLYLASATITKGYIVAWLNNQLYHTAPLTVGLVDNAIARYVLQFIIYNFFKCFFLPLEL